MISDVHPLDKLQPFTNHQPEEFVWGILHLPLSIIAVTLQWGLCNVISCHQKKSIVITYNHHSIPIINHNHHDEPINTPWYRFGVYWNGDKNLWIFAGKSRPHHPPPSPPVSGRRTLPHLSRRAARTSPATLRPGSQSSPRPGPRRGIPRLPRGTRTPARHRKRSPDTKCHRGTSIFHRGDMMGKMGCTIHRLE